MKLLRTIRLDGSDEHALPAPAMPGEFAVTGSFLFSNVDPEELEGKVKIAYATGWLGVESFGFSTFVQVVDIGPEDYEVACRLLAGRFLTDLGAPDAMTALEAARTEIDDSAAIAGDHADGMLLAIEREPDEGGLRERVSVIEPLETGEVGPVWDLG
jgi:hypothetical protein